MTRAPPEIPLQAAAGGEARLRGAAGWIGLPPPAPGGAASVAEQRGFALLIVLWTLTLISLVIMQLNLASRTETRLAANLRAQAQMEAAAEGGIHEAVFHLLDASDGHWAADGTARRLRIGGMRVTVVVANEAGKLNPNTAQPEVLRGLLRGVGADSERAASLALALVDWRFPGERARPGGAKAAEYQASGRDYGPPGKPFQSLGELGLVLGMTPDLLERLIPHLTLHHEGRPDVRVADPIVLQALREAAGTETAPSGPLDETTLVITSVATLGVATRSVATPSVAVTANGGRFERRAVVRLAGRGPGSGPGSGAYTILDWRSPAS